ncbi:conserved Plasmodium protein, unknown function [Plasmodium knowlesi strain H]|uniref:Uncharacterized protein n=3 Tax=Plasmodium knowlesi TaxID=5850 RepID=A0A5K1VRS7_PLAKH|nr:conserved protein, unknown function [Plasmodium knowlesi strain H]OTN64512.1 Uncharacterized protein PKNOH_S130171200 [Plasmodium knowlesi]CAA9988880.1 conserved protein, unknown function [Plasmodium knowlesi strain H]SBO24717.1 conserved Plasmodium protein, unknown function [Plasmodium knowlesi strain H]SBO27989.1 conserved Plasmodium protein, unknown function [Plasmodium knowlesi strain H]VVS78354.1 conserved protein, unknown function [Plasmodium knowlesi strain H]|eukprot:XP_002261227.1 hypothetical protein, conserved in Plasmodium species [Plasmodium knowlesi strain H]
MNAPGKEKRLSLLICRINMLINLLQSRLAFPLIYPFNTTALNNEKSLDLYLKKLRKDGNFNEEAFMKTLAFITPSIISLTKLVHVLKAGHSLCNYSGMSTKLTYTDRKRSASVLKQHDTKLHLLKPQVWRLLKPNDEMNTKHLKWRK